ncbi:Xylulose kinase [Klebsiella pneumoniae]|uniref:Xylulose kinase n=1 Tax=Klebsiella pneumoniae TaxID=573 RepID=A0A377ZZU9_KLEPN|nr:Xylulose kinase [Klebsiella pneumoniae]STV79939.1 Xylulose kinase [Klebsiella pneumoniae]
MYIGIDLGTSGVKAILLNEQGEVVASHTEKTHRLASASAVVGARSRTVVAGDGHGDESPGRAA